MPDRSKTKSILSFICLDNHISWLPPPDRTALSCLALLFLLFIFPFHSFAEQTDQGSVLLTSEEKQWLIEHPIIRVNNEKAWPPLNFYENGEPQGFSVDYLNMLADKIGIRFDYQSGPEFDEFLNRMEKKQLDVMLNVVPTKERDKFILFTEPYSHNPNVIISNRKHKIDDLKQLTGLTIAVPKGFFYEQEIKENIPDIKLLQVDNIVEALKAVSFNKADATLQKEAIAQYLIASNMLMGLHLSSVMKINQADLENLRIGVRSDWPVFRTILDKAIASVSKDELRPLQQKWLQIMENLTPDIPLTKKESEWLKTHNRFSLGIDPRRAPLEEIDNIGHHTGLAKDILSIIADKLDISFNPVKNLSWPGVLMGFENGIVDVAAAMPSTPDRSRHMNFTDAYISLPLMIFTKADHPYIAALDELDQLKVAVINDYAIVEFLEKDHPNIKLLKVDRAEDGLNAVLANKADCYIDTLLTTTHQIQQHGYDSIKVAGETPYKYTVCLAVNKNLPILHSIMQKALASISDQERNSIFSKWRSIQYEHRMDYSKIWKLAGAAIIVILGFAHWNRKLRSEINEREKTAKQLQESEEKTRAMSESVHDGLVMINDQSRIMYWNSAAENLFGIAASEAMGKNLHALILPEEMREKARKGMEHFAKTGKGAVVNSLQELNAQRRDGSCFPVEVGVSGFKIGDAWYAVGTVRDITERIKTQEVVAAIRTELQLIFDNAQVGILYLKNGYSLYRCNNRLADILGYKSPKEMLGLTMTDFHLTSDKERAFDDTFYTPLTSGRLVQAEFELRKKDGSGIWCSINGKATDEQIPADLNQGVILVLDDITEKRNAQKKLKESEKRVKTILDSIHTGTVIIDPVDHHIVDVNPIAAKMINLPPEKIINRTCFEFICPAKEGHCPIVDHGHEIRDSEHVLITNDKKEIPVLKTTTAINLNSREFILESFVDLTEQKKVEKELQENLEELERFYKMAVDREEKMISLKAEINTLLNETGRNDKYTIR